MAGNYILMSLSITILFFILHDSLAFDFYQSCEPITCGGLTIKYPFYIKGQQEPFCGYPGFQVTCVNKSNTIFNLSNNDYVISNISYVLKTVNMVNLEFVQSSFDCNIVRHNLTLKGTMLEFATKHEEVYLLQNCSDEAKRSIREYREGKCHDENNEYGELLAAFGKDIDLNKVAGRCGRVVLVPYQGQNDSDLYGGMKIPFELRWKVGKCLESCGESNGRCGYNMTSSQLVCWCPDGPQPDTCPGKKKSMGRRIVGLIVGSIVGMSILTGLLTYLLRRKSSQEFSDLWSRGKTDNQNVETFLKAYSTLTVKRYTYADIRKMTNSFKDKLGEGGYGSVYKGRFHDGRFVAVKLLKHMKTDGEDFINEVASISRTNHVNIVTLLGFCFEGKRRALIYDFFSKGSLDKYMYDAAGGQSLSLEIQFNIAVGIARGLDYLHRGCNTRILHFDIKPHNILLDDGFCPKISDFGLAKLVCLSKDSTVSMVEARGTIGYIAPEVFLRNFGGVSHKSDVYSYGMMVLDMVCGRKSKSDVVQSCSTLYFPDWIYNQLEVVAEVPDHEIGNDEEKRSLQRKMVIVSLWCIQMYPSKRPSMSRVVEMLEGCLESLEMPPKPDASPSQRLAFDFSTSQITRTQLLI